MKSPYIKELEPNQIVSTFFLVQNKEIRQKKTGEPYLSLALCDRTGELDAKMWDNVVDVMETFERDDFVKVKGLVQIFHNRPQLTIHKMRRVGDHEIEFADYFPASERNADEMLAELRAIVAGENKKCALGGAARRAAERSGDCEPLQDCAGGEADSSRLSRRTDRACAVAM